MAGAMGPWTLRSSLVFTLACVGYLLYIRRQFTGVSAPPAAAARPSA